jgi:hypothetical protein
MGRDEIVEEVRAIRKRLFDEAGGHLDGLFAKLKEWEAKRKERVVSLPPRRPRKGKDEAA